LFAVTWLVYAQTLHHEFVNYDDDQYVYENPRVIGGITRDAVVWAFTHTHLYNWHPLTWISHMLDVEIYGLHAGGHHLTSVLLHAVAAILLFLVLRQMTARVWRSAFVAALFAVHPLHVESVAWIAERKDVLSGAFFMLTIGAYVRYTRRPPSRARYLAVLGLFGLGLASKPMLVTLPIVLLLLDYWPLGRLSPTRSDAPSQPVVRLGSTALPRRVLVEKIPLLTLSLLSSIATVVAQGGAIQPFERLSLPSRLANAVVSFATYLGQTLVPVGLSVLYPYPPSQSPWKVALAAILVVALSAGAFALRRRRPYLLVGWLWYLVVLVPVIGLVQVGVQAHADRYTYLPQIGLCILVTWATAEASAAWRARRAVLGGLAALVIAASIAVANAQAAYWRTGETLWTHALAHTAGNAIAHANLGAEFARSGRVADAVAHFQRALEINPRYAEAHNNLGLAAFQLGRADEALAHYQQALESNPQLLRAHYNLGNALLQSGRMQEAITAYEQALRIEPAYAEVHNNLAIALLATGRGGDAIAHLEAALAIQPDYADAVHNLAWALATAPETALRDGPRAVALAERAYQQSGGRDLQVIGTLAAAYAEAGRFADAVRVANQAIALANATGQGPFARVLEEQLALYQFGRTFHQEPAAPRP
jgi:tetratricopeptide (TPR) repeat protein